MQVIWNKKALSQLDRTLEYGERVFGTTAMQRFYARVMSYVPLLASNPYMGAVEPLMAGRKAQYRSMVIHKHFKLVYRIDEQRRTIRIAALWDTRREPRRQAGEV